LERFRPLWAHHRGARKNRTGNNGSRGPVGRRENKIVPGGPSGRLAAVQSPISRKEEEECKRATVKERNKGHRRAAIQDKSITSH